MVVGKRFVLAKQFEGEPKDGDLVLETFEVPPVKDGGKPTNRRLYILYTR